MKGGVYRMLTDHCTSCNQCNPHCPQGIDIPKELQRIDRFVEQLKQETL